MGFKAKGFIVSFSFFFGFSVYAAVQFAAPQAVEALPILMREATAIQARQALIQTFGTEIGGAIWVSGGQAFYEVHSSRMAGSTLTQTDVVRLRAMVRELEGPQVLQAATQLAQKGEAITSQSLVLFARASTVPQSTTDVGPALSPYDEELLAFNAWAFTPGSPASDWASRVRYAATPEAQAARRNFGALALKRQQGVTLCSAILRSTCEQDTRVGLERFAAHEEKLIVNEAAVDFEGKVLSRALGHTEPHRIFAGNARVLSQPLRGKPISKCFEEGENANLN